MSPNKENYRAGLDHNAVALPTSNTTTSVTLDGVPYVSITKTIKSGPLNGRVERLALEDKSYGLNTVDAASSGTNSTQPTFLIAENLPNLSSLGFESTLFHQTASLPYTWSFRFPSFLDLSLHFITSGGDSGSIPPYVSPSHPLPQILPTTVNHIHRVEGTQPTMPGAPIGITSMTHPNSPYVPWTSQLKQEILEPSTSAPRTSGFSDCYSHSYSSTCARTAEPVNLPHNDNNPPSRRSKDFLSVSKSLRNLRLALRKNVSHVSKHIARLKKSHQPIPTTQLPHAEELGAVNRPSHCYSPSIGSFDSSATDTLTTWLMDRQRATLEHRRNEAHYTSLDEYERMGSWLNLSQGSNRSKEGLETTKPTIEHSFYTSCLSKEPSPPRPPMASTPTQSYSDSPQSLDYGDLSLLQPSGLEHSPSSSRSREGGARELNMPGGWTFRH